MNYFLDTNVCIIYLKGRNLNLKHRLEAIPVQEIAVCLIVKAELCFGVMKSADPERNFALQQTFLAQFVMGCRLKIGRLRCKPDCTKLDDCQGRRRDHTKFQK